MNINLKLKQIVDERGIKQAYISEKTGMSADCISRILNSTRKITGEELLNICELLNIDPRELKNTA